MLPRVRQVSNAHIQNWRFHISFMILLLLIIFITSTEANWELLSLNSKFVQMFEYSEQNSFSSLLFSLINSDHVMSHGGDILSNQHRYVTEM